MSVVIRNGRVVTAVDDYFADLYIENETITRIGAKLDVRADQALAAGRALE